MRFRHRLRSIATVGSLIAAGSAAAADGQATAPPTASSDLTVVAGQLDEARAEISPSLGATTYDIGPGRIDTQAQGADAPFNQVLLRAPGVAQDSFGQVHVRGEHANLQYRINDVLLPEGITGFGQELDTRFAQDITFITGALPAQYGFRTAGVVDIHTKSGLASPGGDVSMYGGSYDTIRPSAQYGGSIDGTDAFALASYLHSSLGIENPTPRRTAIHDDTDQVHAFADVSTILDKTSRLSVIASVSESRFEIPDNPGQAPGFTLTGVPTADSAKLDERQTEGNEYGVVAYQKSAGAIDYQLAGYARRSAVDFHPDHAGDLIFNGVASEARLSTVSLGTQLDGSLRAGDDHTVRAGGSVLAQHAVDDSTTFVFPVDAGGNQTSSDPFAVVDDHAKWGWFEGVYLQDEWRVTPRWTVNYGARFDVVDAYVHENQVSPRLNTTLKATDTTTLHAGYARYFTPPPLESVPQTTLAKFAGTTNEAATPENDPVRSERAHYFDAGVTQAIGRRAQVGIDGYYKRSQHTLDEGQFGSAVIFTPFNYRHGTVYGVELSSAYQDPVFGAYANLAASRSSAQDIESAQFNFDPAELDYIRTHEVLVDHDQRYTASAGTSYAIVHDLRLLVDALYGSGLRSGFANTDKLPSYVTVNVGIEYAWRHLRARFDVVNIFDKVYELRDGSGIGVGAPQFGMRRGFFGGLTYEF